MGEDLTYETERDGDAGTIRIHGDLDMSGMLRLEQEITRLAERERVRELTLDLSEVTFIDSTGLGLIINTHQSAEQEGFALHLVPGPREVHRVFEMVGLADILPFTGSASGTA